MLPELRGAIKDFLRNSRSEPVELGLKGVIANFDSVNVEWYARNGYPRIHSLLTGGSPAWSGESVSVASALNHSVVWACTRLISESVAFLPLNMLRRKSDGTEVTVSHPMSMALHNAPNVEMTAMTFREALTAHVILRGNSYAQIVRRSGTGREAIELWPLLPSQVRPDRDKSKRLVYVVKDSNEEERTYTVQAGKPQDILHIHGLGEDGVVGYGVITMARQSIGTALATERNVASFYKNGGRVPYILEMGSRFRNDEDYKQFRAEWEKVYAEPHRAPILENGTKYQQIGLSAKDAQMLETRMFDIHEICRWFRVSPHLVGDLSRATFSNIEQLALEFVSFTLSSWLTRWEQELWRSVLTDDEKSAGYFFRHNANALLRGDFASRMAGYSTMLQNGIASINEVRDLEDWNPIDGGDDHHIQLNMQTIPGGTPLPSQGQQQTQQEPSQPLPPNLVRIGGKKPA